MKTNPKKTTESFRTRDGQQKTREGNALKLSALTLITDMLFITCSYSTSFNKLSAPLSRSHLQTNCATPVLCDSRMLEKAKNDKGKMTDSTTALYFVPHELFRMSFI
jgi:hypothetical protein